MKLRLSHQAVAWMLCGTVLAASIAGCTSQAQYPTKAVHIIVGWAAGGMTDRIMRGIAPLAEKNLGQPIVVTNMPGATSAISVQHVFSQPADGYTILGGAENPALFQVLDLSQRSYDDFDPIILLASAVPTIVVRPDAPWKDIKEFVADLKAKGKDIKMGYTGPGGQPHVTGTIMKMSLGVDFTLVPYDGEGPAITAVMGKQVDFTVTGATACIEHVRAGKVKALATFAGERIKGLENVPLLQDEFPEMRKYLPFGAWYGIFVKKGTPQEVKDKLTTAFKQAASTPEWKKLLEDMAAIPLQLVGDDATKFIKRWQSVACWMLQEAGAAKKSPAEFNIPKP
ncbi:MAG: Bug family tripartite tricarboxylate transporter substrate binding protein [Bacillota bacterium]